MANVNLLRGGTPDFKGYFCDGQWAEFNPPFDAPNMPGTPLWDSHADAAYGQGYLNLHFPLIPNLANTRAHAFMQSALRGLAAVGDTIDTNWIPLWSYLDSYCITVKTTDANLDGVYVTPVANRIAYDFTTKQWTRTPVTAWADAMTAGGIGQLPLGTPASGDKTYGITRFADNAIPATFGHQLVQRDPATGDPTAGLDSYYGAVIFGLQISAGEPANIANIWRSRIAVYTSAKLLAFEGASQVG